MLDIFFHQKYISKPKELRFWVVEKWWVLKQESKRDEINGLKKVENESSIL